ncbi:MAG: hypothetical protein ACI3YB_07770 [Prevotella sp.]
MGDNMYDFMQLLSTPVLSDVLRSRLLNRRLYSSFTATDTPTRYPKRGYKYDVGTGYSYSPTDALSLNISYKFGMNYQQSAGKLYCLEHLEGWGADSDRPVGMLPSVAYYLGTFDKGNSCNMLKHENNHQLDLRLFSV